MKTSAANVQTDKPTHHVTLFKDVPTGKTLSYGSAEVIASETEIMQSDLKSKEGWKMRCLQELLGSSLASKHAFFYCPL